MKEKERRRSSEAVVPGLEQATQRADKALLEAEKYRANIAQPGKQLPLEFIQDIGAGVSDDDFFHLTCHIDPNLIHKIEKGEFIELEKLLPKDKLGQSNNEESRLE